jgi:hypothetical protein
MPAAHRSVVGQPDQSPPARFHLQPELRRPSVQRVFEQLLDDASRPFHHLSSGDLVRDVVRKNTNAAHEKKKSVARSQ